MPRFYGVLLLACWTFAFIGCAGTEPHLTARDEIVVGESPSVIARGLVAGAEYAVVVEMSDVLHRAWRSESRFRADACGTIDLARDIPLDSLYDTPTPFGLLSAMSMPTPTPEDWEAPEPRDYNQLVFRLLRGGEEIAASEIRQWVVPPGLPRERLGGNLVAELFHPPNASQAPGVLLLGGSGGGMTWARRNAALLARAGYAALAVAYFNAEGLPPDLVEIPLESVETALDSLKRRPEVDATRIAVMGYSKGAELALLLASRRSDVRAVVTFAPGSAVFQGFRAPDYPVVSSWSVRGSGLPFVPNAYDKKFFETFDGMYLWYRTLAQHDAFANAAIPVERINGDVLLISGVEDRIWPATFMGEQIVARLRVRDFEHGVQHLAFAQAGHGIAAPPGEPLSSVAQRLGGTVSGNENARAHGWRSMLEFLSRTLAP